MSNEKQSVKSGEDMRAVGVLIVFGSGIYELCLWSAMPGLWRLLVGIACMIFVAIRGWYLWREKADSSRTKPNEHEKGKP